MNELPSPVAGAALFVGVGLVPFLFFGMTWVWLAIWLVLALLALVMSAL